MSTHNTGFYEEISKIIPELSSIKEGVNQELKVWNCKQGGGVTMS